MVFWELGCCAFLPHVVKGCGVCGPCEGSGAGTRLWRCSPSNCSRCLGKANASQPAGGRWTLRWPRGPDVHHPLPPGVRTCTGRPGTRSASTTCATTRLAPASTRRTRVATAPRTGRTAPSPTALWTCGHLCVTSGEWLSYQEPLCSPASGFTCLQWLFRGLDFIPKEKVTRCCPADLGMGSSEISGARL